MVKQSAEIKQKLKKAWLWALIVIASAAVWVLGFYWASRTPLDKKFYVWVGAPVNVNAALSDEIESICLEHGMEQVNVNNYNPNDGQYAAAFALQSESVDVYIIRRDEALNIAQAKVFAELDEKYKDSERSIEYDGKTIGVRFKEEYYVLIGAKSRKDKTLLYKVLDAIVAYGESV